MMRRLTGTFNKARRLLSSLMPRWRALAHIIQAASAMDSRPALHAPVLAQTIPFYHDLPSPYFSGHSDRRDRAHKSKARILEGTNLVLPFTPS
jgi:hypothetical protein